MSELDDQIGAAWERYHTGRSDVVDLTLRGIVATVTELVSEAATLHLVIRYPDKVGYPDRWSLAQDFLRGADGQPIHPDPEVERQLEDSLHEPLYDLADLEAVTDTAVIDLRADPSSTFTRSDEEQEQEQER
jgi:hypothetical protein